MTTDRSGADAGAITWSAGRPAVVCVVQARIGSSRLPGKVLMDLSGRPVLDLMLQRLRPLEDRGWPIVVATSAKPGDDAVARTAAASGAAVVRGSEDDVLGRFGLVLDQHPADAVVRLTADCPLMDPVVVAAVVDAHLASRADYTSNTLVRTYPRGLDVEVVAATALVDAVAEATDPAEREHVTPFVYRRPDRYRLAGVVSGQLLGDERWTLDTMDDLVRLREIVGALEDPVRATWLDTLAGAGRRAAAPAGAIYLRCDTTVPVSTGRAWDVVRDDAVLGRARITVGPEATHLVVDAEDSLMAPVRALVEQALRGDLQTRLLVS